MNDVVNPIAPPAPDVMPNEGMDVSQEAREFALAPVYVSPGVNRAPTNEEQLARLAQAKEILGDGYHAPIAAQPTAAQRAEADRLTTIGVKPGASGNEYALNLPAGVAPEAADIIRSGLASLEFSPTVGTYLAQRIADLGSRFNGMSEADKASWSAEQHRILEQWATSKGWDLEARRADVKKLLTDRKVPDLVAGIIGSDADMAIRLMLHADHLKTVKR